MASVAGGLGVAMATESLKPAEAGQDPGFWGLGQNRGDSAVGRGLLRPRRERPGREGPGGDHVCHVPPAPALSPAGGCEMLRLVWRQSPVLGVEGDGVGQRSPWPGPWPLQEVAQPPDRRPGSGREGTQGRRAEREGGSPEPLAGMSTGSEGVPWAPRCAWVPGDGTFPRCPPAGELPAHVSPRAPFRLQRTESVPPPCGHTCPPQPILHVPGSCS